MIEASRFSIMFRNITTVEDFFTGYGKWIIIAFGILGFVLIVICVSICYVKAKRDRSDMIQRHMDNS